MVAQYRRQNRLFLAKIEPPGFEGQDALPTPADDAMLCENPQLNPNFETQDPDEVTGSLDSRGAIPGGGYFEKPLRVYMKGPGAGNGGTAPEVSTMLRASAMAETLTAADETGVAQAGSLTSITLAAGAPANDLTGMVIAITSGAGAGQLRVIAAYNGTTKVVTPFPDFDVATDVTSNYTIYANALYAPASTSLEVITTYLYKLSSQAGGQAHLTRVVGAASTFTLEATTRQAAYFDFTARGILDGVPTNVADPGSPTYDPGRPVPFMAARAYFGGGLAKFRTLTIDYGGEVQQPDDPAQPFGYDIAGVTQRRIRGSINPQLELLSVRNAMADFISGTESPLWLSWGTPGGRAISIFLPAVQVTTPGEEEVDGFEADAIDFASNGIDSGMFLCFY